MALKCAGLLGSHVSDLGRTDSGTKPSGLSLNCSLLPPESRRTWVCVAKFSGSPADGTMRPVEDKARVKPGAQFSNVPSRLHKDLNNLPKPLSIHTNPSDCSKMRISFKGGPGSYTEEAALKAYPFCQTVACDGFEDVFKAVELWMADKAVLPIENSSCGSIHRNYDLLIRHRLHIVGEVQLPVNLCLLALPGIRAEQLQRVISHPQALTLSDKYLSELGVTRVNVDDTAGAAKFVASENLRDAGVVASVRAAEIYGLNVLAQGIQDVSDNITRFLVLARDPIIPRTDKPFKTSIVCTLEEGPGILFKALAVFALRNINLTKIESRPQRKRPLRVVDDSNTGSAKYFDYLFYIDFEASMADPRAQYALGHLQEFATFLRILGCYPMDTSL